MTAEERRQQLEKLHKMSDRNLLRTFLQGQCQAFSHLIPLRNEQLQGILDVKDEMISRRYSLDVSEIREALR